MNRSSKVIAAFIIIVSLVAASYTALSYSGSTGDTLSVFSADAYVPEVTSLLSNFHNSTGIKVAPVKGGGSFADARQIALGSPASVFISVSLESYSKSFLGNYSSGWALAFAADQMVLAYSNATEKNANAVSIISQFNRGTPDNNSRILSEAFTNLSSGKVKVGISDPQSDPAGVRGWLSLEMAGYLYHNGNSSYFSSLMGQNHANYSGSNAAQLVSPLTQGQIQFLFIYRSSAITHGLPYVELPAAVNQGNASMSKFYGQFTYGTGSSAVSGSPILLFVSIIKNGTAFSDSEKFVSFLINNTAVFRTAGLSVLDPMLLYGNSSGIPSISWGLSSGLIRNENTVI